MVESLDAIRRWQRATVALGIVVAIVIWAFFDPVQQINDAGQYASSARNLRDRGEFATSCVFYGEHYAYGAMPAPQTVFPPGYPALMATVSWLTGSSLRDAGFGINLLCFVGSGWALFSLCRRLGSRADVAFFCSGCWLLSNIMWHATWLNLSESSFMFFAILAVRLLLESGFRFAIAAGLCAAASITMRYAGVFLAFAVGVNHAMFALRVRNKKPLTRAVVFCVPPALALIAMFSRNAALSGSMRGGNDYQMAEPLSRVILRFAASIGRIFGLNRHVLDDATTAIITAGAGLCVAAGGAWFLLARRRAAENRPQVESTAGSWLTLSFPVIYAAILFVLEITVGAGLTDRLMVPVLPFVFAAIARFVSCSGTSRGVMLSAAAGLAVAFGLTQIFVHKRLISEAPPSHALNDVLQSRLEPRDESLQAFLAEKITDQHPLLCNEPQLVHSLLRRPVVGLPTKRYNTGPEWSAQRVRDDVLEPYGVKFVLLAKGARLVTEDSPLFFRQLDEGTADPALRVVSDADAYTLFEVVR